MEILFPLYEDVPALEERLLEWGYDGVEYHLPDRRDVSPGPPLVKLPGLRAVKVVHAPPDTYDQRRFQQALVDACFVARQCHAPLINVHPPALSRGGRSNVRKGIEFLLDLQQRDFSTIAYEVQASPGDNEQKRGELGYEKPTDWLRDVKRYDLWATLDTTHVASWGESPLYYLEQLDGRYLRHVHLSGYDDKTGAQHLPPYQGTVNLRPILQLLGQQHPGCTLTVEVSRRYRGLQWADIARRSLAFVREFLGS